MSRKHISAYATFQRGKGLVGFLAGLVLATMIIIAVLLMLNSNSKRGFSKSETNAPKATETLTPAGVSGVAPETANTPLTQMASDTIALNTQQNQSNNPNTSASEVPALTDNTNPNQADTTEPTNPNDILQPIDDPALNGDNTASDPNVNNPTPPKTNTVPNNVRPEGDSTIKKTPSNTGNLDKGDLDLAPPTRTTPPKPREPVARERNNDREPARTVVRPATPIKNNNTVNHTPSVRPQPKPHIAQQPVNPPRPQVAIKPATPVNKPTVAETNKRPQPKPHTADIKPTPQQILDSGNIEAARELARRQAAARAAAPKAAAASRQAHAAGNVVIQAGAYSTRNSAESQRARLALLGVQTKVVEATVNGKPTFRVQTYRMDGSQASQARHVLNKNGISTLERTVD